MNILGINAYHPDASVALIRDGVPVWAAEEERFNRVKHSSGFPTLALQQCLKETGLPPQAIDFVAISKNPRVHFLKKIAFVLKNRPERALVFNRLKALSKASQFEKDLFHALHVSPAFLKARFVHVEHHQCHVASSIFFSGFQECAFLSIDGLGDFSSAMWGRYRDRKVETLDRVFFPHSAGFLYTAGTQFLGFHHFGDEYKVMGLAAYGKPVHLQEFRRMIRFKPKGQFELDLGYFTHQLGRAKIRWEGGAPEQDMMFSAKWEELFGPARQPGEPVTRHHQDLAASLQALLEEVLFHILNYLCEKTGQENLCLAGGVAFNCAANGKITRETSFKNIYIPPAAGDAGTALGAASFVWHWVLNHRPKFVMDQAYWGGLFTDHEVAKVLQRRGLECRHLTEDELIEKTVAALADGKVVGWFQGRMEFGPRALGNRSILADPRRADMKDILNQRIKHRETFRPFAPAVTEEAAHDYFEMDCPSSPFMLKVFPVKPGKEKLLPATSHVDGTARVQTVSKKQNEIFWKLLKKFGEKTGVPVLLNTSFNENEPIVCTPDEAVECFLKTKMDVLVLGCFLIEKTGNP